MIGTSIVVIFFLMYLHSYQLLDHAWFSKTRAFMALIMGAGMIGVLLGIYRNSKANVFIYVGASLLFVASLWPGRSHATVDDSDYIKGMIPHHSIALSTSEHSGIRDPFVTELAVEIIEAQRPEIQKMKWLIADIEANGVQRLMEPRGHAVDPRLRGLPSSCSTPTVKIETVKEEIV